MADFENIKLSIAGRRANITLARPDKLNPLDWSTVRELKRVTKQIDANEDISFVVITGEGRSFSAGGDLDGYLHLYRHPEEFAAFLADFYDMLVTIEQSPKIYIAAINGICVAGGLELLLACDLVIAPESARIGDAHLNFGQLPGAGGSQRLPRAVGMLRAKYLMMTGVLISAQTAAEYGLVSLVVADDDFTKEIDALVDNLSAKSVIGLRGMKTLSAMSEQLSLEEGLKQEIEYVHRYATTERDATEGLVAFKEKRQPKFNKGEN
ncbi:enoyl-CoA hydratase/isomerase family protein [Hyphococcus sp. DH-69]|uniref:enoyl-CoA hydratase/isomerase family protein n=1 Tax=Hyphococcus formosus TaxID=3143534 RepID=UPI00398BB3B8